MKKQKPKVQQLALIEAWKDVPIGTDVIVTKDFGQGDVRTKTTSGPLLLGGHTAVIMLDGISGCYSLEKVRRVSQQEVKKA